MSSPSAQHREVLRYFYSAIVIVVASTVVLVGGVLARHVAESRDRERLEGFHLRSLMLVNEASERLDDLERQVTEAAGSELSAPGTRRARLAVRATGEALSALQEIQRQRGDTTFVATMARANRQYLGLEDALQREGRLSVRSQPALEGLGFTLFQLSRLHSIAAESLLRDLDARGRRVNLLLTLGFGAVVLLTAVLVGRTLSLLRATLRRHARTADDLRERETQLQQASKMEALGTLVGGVAHDFNNLLTAILGNAEILQARLGPSRSIGNELREITRAGERAANLTRQMLAFSRQEQIEPRIVDLNLLLRETEPMLQRLLPADISLSLHLGPGLYDVEIDPVQIEQVIVNLAVNARDAMPEGGRLTIRTRNYRADSASSEPPAIPAGAYARVTVEDTGCGMDPELSARVFEPFFTTKERGGGTGLGLSTVHGIVTRSNGHIAVESATGVGSRFEIFLPRAARKPELARDTNGIRVVASGSGTVLLAEDEEQVRELTANGLREAGYRVLVARNGREAVEICESFDGEIDLVVTDVVMPEMRGPALVARALQTHPQARVVYISGYTDAETLTGAAGSGAPLLHKPFKLQGLLEIVARELEQVEGRDIGT